MKNHIFCILALVPMLCSCDKFLNVNPKSEVTDGDMFKTATNCEDAIYGIYADMGYNSNLEGYILSFRLPELMMGNFEPQPSDDMAYLVQRQWTDDKAVKVAEQIWTAGYTSISYINNALKHILPMPDDKFRYVKLYKGELLALRAFMHFEMARIFAVSFASSDAAAKSKAIPYSSHYGIQITPYSSLESVFEKIVNDLKEAEKFLDEDKNLISATRTNTANGFTSCRIIHMNLYAVQAMLARVYWTMGDLVNAEEYALKVIDSRKFQLMSQASEWNASENGTLNMLESLFGLYSSTFVSTFHRNHIYGAAAITLSPDYQQVYNKDHVGSDKRLNKWFNTQQSKCMKNVNDTHATSGAYAGNSIMGLSLIRIPEMYYIVAEANLSKNPSKAMEYLDYVVESRGLTKFANREGVTTITADDIFNERRKEFYAEGQDFYNMKRLQKDIQIKGLDPLSGAADATYTMPIPESVEDNHRD